jgi:hypothetical protein
VIQGIASSASATPIFSREWAYDEGMNQSSLDSGLDPGPDRHSDGNPLLVRRRWTSRRRDFLALAALVFYSCTPPKVKDNRIRHPMGQRVSIGPLTFNVLEMKWEQSLGDGPLGRTPQRRFLLLRLSVTNGGGTQATVPTLVLLNEEGERFRELEDTKGLSDPMGLIRMVGAGETLFGWILFDVPQNDYLLELSDGNLENEQTALVEIPLRLT